MVTVTGEKVTKDFFTSRAMQAYLMCVNKKNLKSRTRKQLGKLFDHMEKEAGKTNTETIFDIKACSFKFQAK